MVRDQEEATNQRAADCDCGETFPTLPAWHTNSSGHSAHPSP
jgi:hypothetical protein